MAVETANYGVNIRHVERVPSPLHWDAGNRVASRVVVRIATLHEQSNSVFLDSQNAEDLVVNPVYHKRFKHIENEYHWVREHVDPDGEFGTARLMHV